MQNIITQEEKNRIDTICFVYGIKNYNINPDGSIDVMGSVNIGNRRLSELPIKFNTVSSNFLCHNNKLTSLKGCPTKVGKDFNCSGNYLTSLEGCPNTIGRNFKCTNNDLKSLDHCPTVVSGVFEITYNRFSRTFMDIFNDLKKDSSIHTFLKYQHQCGIWYDGFDEEACQELASEIKDGLL